MNVKVYFGGIGKSKFKDITGSRPFVISVSSRETADEYSELPVSNMSMEERLEVLQRMAIETFKKGFRAGGGGKYFDVDKDIVIENGKIVIKMPKGKEGELLREMDIKTNVSISTKGLTPYEIGKLTAENKIRGLDSDPKMRTKKFKHKIFDADNIRRWVEEVKLPQNPVEWQFVNRLHGDDRDRAINKIVNAVIYGKGGIMDKIVDDKINKSRSYHLG